MNTQKNAVVIANVKQEFEAVSIVAALGDAGISAVRQQATKGGILSLPGAMGLPEEGYDILVSPEDAGSALDILIGMGYADVQEDSEKTAEGEEDSSADEGEDIAPAEEAEIGPVKLAIYKALSIFLTLAGIAVFVWLCDYLINLVKSLF